MELMDKTMKSATLNGTKEKCKVDGIEHRMVNVNGINMHIAEKGRGEGHPVVLLIHGFPEFWYTWRHQIVALASVGYHAVAPDLRGCGDTDAPPEVTSYTCHHIVGDLVALVDHLGVEKVFLVAHDWGAMLGWYMCLFRPDLVKAYVTLTVPFRPRNPKMKPVQLMRTFLGDDYYMCRFQEGGGIEAEIERSGTRDTLLKILTERKPGPPMLPKGQGFTISSDFEMPAWLKKEDIAFYTSKYEQRGFTGGLNYYRTLDLNWELTAPWMGMQVKVPVKFIVGDLDMTYTTPGVKEYVHGGGFKEDVPLLEDIVVMENVGHFINQEKADEINALIYEFIKKF